MGRPSVKAERAEAILTAFESCVARFGVEGTSLERIAEASGMSRSLLRHNIGNRDELVDAMAVRFISRYEESTDEWLSYLPEEQPSKALIESLFAADDVNWQSVLVAEALIASAQSYPKVQALLHDWYEGLLRRLSQVLEREHPKASAEECWDVIVAVVGIYFNTDALRTLNLSDRHRQAGLDMSLRLLASLKG